MNSPAGATPKQALEEARALLKTKQSAIDTLNLRVASLQDSLKAKQEAMAALNQRIATQLDAIAAKNASLARSQDTIEALRARVTRLREAERHQAGFDTLAHNDAAGMDAFFANVEDSEVYVRFGAAVRALMDRHGLTPGGVDLGDFGTGPGLALKALIADSQPRSIAGFDFSIAALEIARRELPDGRFEIADIYQPHSGRFDLVLCMEVLEHLEYPARAMTTLTGTVRPGGALVLTVPQGRLDRSRYHINFWSPESWRVFVAEAAPSGWDHLCGTFGVPSGEDETSDADVPHRNNFAILRRPAGPA